MLFHFILNFTDLIFENLYFGFVAFFFECEILIDWYDRLSDLLDFRFWAFYGITLYCTELIFFVFRFWSLDFLKINDEALWNCFYTAVMSVGGGVGRRMHKIWAYRWVNQMIYTLVLDIHGITVVFDAYLPGWCDCIFLTLWLMQMRYRWLLWNSIFGDHVLGQVLAWALVRIAQVRLHCIWKIFLSWCLL